MSLTTTHLNFSTTLNMARKPQVKKCVPKGLLSLPNKILHDIVSHLSTLNLRRLSRVNKRLHFFVESYLVQYRYNSGLVALPNEIILEIVQQLDRQKDRSSLARASLRFYPLIMDYIYRHNVQYGGSGLLNYAAKRNLSGMTREILRLGGDVNTQHGIATDTEGQTTKSSCGSSLPWT